MYAAMRWDDDELVEGWAVMAYLNERRQHLRNKAIQVRRRESRRTSTSDLPAVALEGAGRDAMLASWHGSSGLLALLFAPPDATAMRELNARKEYFDVRTGDRWSLFFPGYFEIGTRGVLRRDPFIGRSRNAGDWRFDGEGFDRIRAHVAGQSAWRYSGATDLVLIGVWLPEEGAIEIDWASTVGGELTTQGCISIRSKQKLFIFENTAGG